MSEETSGERNNWRFTLHYFEQLNSDKNKWRHILEEAVKMDPDRCAYCESKDELSAALIVLKKMCPPVGLHNIVRACKKCNLSKGNKDLLVWQILVGINKTPRNIMKRYLKMLYMCHECNGTLDSFAFDENGKIELAYLNYVFEELCDPDKVKSQN